MKARRRDGGTVNGGTDVGRLRRYFEEGGGSGDSVGAEQDARRLARRLERVAAIVPGLRERVALSDETETLESRARRVPIV